MSWGLTLSAKTYQGHSLGVSVHTPLRYLWETDEKDWRIRQCSHKMPSKSEWNFKLAQQRNVATQVARLCLHKHFVKGSSFLKVLTHLLYCTLSRHRREQMPLSSRAGEGVTETLVKWLRQNIDLYVCSSSLSCSKGWINPRLWMTLPRRHTSRFKLSINRAAWYGSLKVIYWSNSSPPRIPGT